MVWNQRASLSNVRNLHRRVQGFQECRQPIILQKFPEICTQIKKIESGARPSACTPQSITGFTIVAWRVPPPPHTQFTLVPGGFFSKIKQKDDTHVTHSHLVGWIAIHPYKFRGLGGLVGRRLGLIDKLVLHSSKANEAKSWQQVYRMTPSYFNSTPTLC